MEATPPIEVDLGARIRTLRLAQGATLRKLAAEAGVTESFLRRWSAGSPRHRSRRSADRARALGQSIAELFAAETSVPARWSASTIAGAWRIPASARWTSS
jgi:transcriptional regulator with XRE-family HTH domain